MFEGLMQNDYQLTTRHVLERVRRFGAASEVVTLMDGGEVRRASYPEVAARADRLASALAKLGVRAGDRVGTFMWNNQEHFEAYLAVPAMGAVLNTVNIRLFPEQVTYIINHAKDRVLLVDDSLVEVLGKVAGELESVEHALETARKRRIQPVEPRVVLDEGGVARVLMPGEPGYDDATQEPA